MGVISQWGFCGGTYAGQSHAVNVERCVNMYPEVTGAAGQRSKRQVVLYPTPGLAVWASSVGTGPIRGIFYQDGQMFVASGSELYYVSPAAGKTLICAIANDGYNVTMISSGSAGNQLFVVSAGHGYIISLTTLVATPIVDVDFPSRAVVGDYSDAYFLALQGDSAQFNFSSLNDGTNWPTTSFAVKSQSSDNIKSLIVDHKEVWLFGSKTTEVWFNTGNAQNPFAPIQGVLIEHGIHAIRSAVKVNNTICWLGQDTDGAGQMWFANGYTPQRFSTHGVEEMWKQYGVTLEDAIAWAYQENGHTFYIITFPTARATWGFDFSSQMWHERGYWEDSQYTAHLGRCHAYGYGKHLLGSRIDGTIYVQSLDYYDDAGAVLRRMRRTPHVTADQYLIEYNSATLECQKGVGLAFGQGSDPQVMMRFSNDDGNIWSNEKWTSVGARGKYGIQARWRLLGQGRNRVWEVVQTDPVPLAWTDLILDADKLAA